PKQRAVVVETRGHDAHILRGSRGGGKCCQRGGIEARHIRYVVEIDILEQVSVLLPVLHTDVLVLVVEVLPPLREADCGEALFIEGKMVASAEVAVEAELENRAE